jgi:zinc protease
MQGQAQDLGASWLAATDLNFSERYLAAVKRVTPADLLRVARQYLTVENRTLYALLPTGKIPTQASVTELTSDQPIRKFELANGLRLLVKEDHRLPFVEFRAVFKGGVLVEEPRKNGITQLAGKMLLKGTKSRTARQIAGEIESVGGSIDSYGGNNSFGVNAEVMSEDFHAGLDLLSDVLLNPAFPGDALEREREVQLAGIRAQRDQLLQSASKAMRRELFGARGYGLDSLGTETSVRAITTADLADFHRSLAAPDNCVLAIYGDVDVSKARELVEEKLGHWKRRSGATSDGDNGNGGAVNSVRRVTEIRDKKQAVLVIGYEGAALRDADRYPLEILQEACSDLGSRLFLRIRDELGLAYYVGAQNFIGLAPGYFAFYCGTMPEQAALVEEELLKQAGLLRADGLTADELKRAKAKIIGQKKISRQDLGTLAMTTALDELYGLGFNYSEQEDALYEAVTLDAVKAAARKYLKPDALVISVVRPE